MHHEGTKYNVKQTKASSQVVAEQALWRWIFIIIHTEPLIQVIHLQHGTIQNYSTRETGNSDWRGWSLMSQLQIGMKTNQMIQHSSIKTHLQSMSLRLLNVTYGNKLYSQRMTSHFNSLSSILYTRVHTDLWCIKCFILIPPSSCDRRGCLSNILIHVHLLHYHWQVPNSKRCEHLYYLTLTMLYQFELSCTTYPSV